ncbi:hypothetical protein GOODEAATRI_018078 [Goodea atripinnis]|uniref:XRRM domain-containing protein n=1 Tax=Goodea atripinnis TaxID=208336 RepID=A0ABV0MT91_9TELE
MLGFKVLLYLATPYVSLSLSVLLFVSAQRKEWLQLKEEYLVLQKRSMASLKKCINKINHKEGDDALSKVSPVAYIDILEGDVEGHIRFNTPEDATAVSGAREQLLKEHSWKLEILKGFRFHAVNHMHPSYKQRSSQLFNLMSHFIFLSLPSSYPKRRKSSSPEPRRPISTSDLKKTDFPKVNHSKCSPMG